eukprot:TRINITY_DN122236_c0_g1_i1.p1 TRINITY_DN122236_c0_g1~~TRINITY_DN122236_c0_g1_i1.p1  ORF type:complete len:293 (+),score=18.99 TRINITY_DN122236_c0_g1_i1:119-880(+)
MTDRFYPVGLQADEDVWKTTYEVQNDMRSFARSPYPPGCAVHQPGARDKFGFSSPGPLPHRLAKPELCQVEDTDIPNPRAYMSIPRYQCPDDKEIFQELDVPEMQRSYRSPVATMSMSASAGFKPSASMSKTYSLPDIGMRKSVSRLTQPNAPLGKLEDDRFKYFVPKDMAREGEERLLTRNLSKIDKTSPVTMPWGDGTGFRTSNSSVEWWPGGTYSASMPTSYRAAYKRHSFFRMSPLAHGQQGAASATSY